MICTNLCKLIVLQIIFLFCCFSIGNAQNIVTDTSKTPTVPFSIADSSQTINHDSLSITNDSIIAESAKYFPISSNAVTSIVDYFAQDSVCFNLDSSTVYLYHNTDLYYEDINLKANYVEINFAKNQLFSKGVLDTLEKLEGTPVFKQGTYEVKSHELTYNFESKKGYLRNVITQEGESYLHGKIVKKNEDNTSFIRHGKYTTCNLDHPHFEIAFGKAKVIPNDKIVTGPLYVCIAAIPTFLALPFGFFPNSDKHTNGLIFPKYGQHNELGAYLEGIGYYFALKDKVDFAVTANIYMRGAFGVGVKSNYVKRYKFNGNVDLQYAYTPTGERTTEQFSQKHDFSIKWYHQQDAKAHPVNRFSANVNFRTSSFSKNTVEKNISDYTQSKALSTVNFSTNFKGKYSLGINAELSQDLIRKNLDMRLPQINFGVGQFYPFRRKQVIGKLRWYENISMQYTVDMQNLINTYDSVLIQNFKHAFDDYRMGVNHNIPVKSTIKILKYISWTNSITLVETWQVNKGVRQEWDGYNITEDTVGSIIKKDTIGSIIRKDTNIGFHMAHNLTISTGLSTTIYGMYTFKKGKVSVFRHTLTPSVSFNYRPGINKHLYKKYYDPYSDKEVQYSTAVGSLYSIPDYKSSGKINFSISNRLEMKVRQTKDGEESFKKVTLLDNLTLSSAYDILKDSLRWDVLTLSGRTTLFKYFNIDFSLNFDPYIIDNNGYRVNRYEIKENNRLFRFSSTSWRISTGINLNREFFKRKKVQDKKEERKESPSGFGDWNISLNYNFSYNMRDNYDYYKNQRFSDTLIPTYTHEFNNSLSINGNFVLTSKWSMNFTTGYNFKEKSITPSEFGVERDLHCWVISFKWRPFGYTRGFEFGIRAKANILRDVKYDHRKDLYDYY